MLKTGDSPYALIEMIRRVKLFTILPDSVQLRLLLHTSKQKDQSHLKNDFMVVHPL